MAASDDAREHILTDRMAVAAFIEILEEDLHVPAEKHAWVVEGLLRAMLETDAPVGIEDASLLFLAGWETCQVYLRHAEGKPCGAPRCRFEGRQN